MSKSSRARWHKHQRELAHTQKAQLPVTLKQEKPVLLQNVTVERSPFTPPAIEPRGDARIQAHKDLTRDYVPSGTMGWYPFLKALPPYIDDITQQFGAQIYDQMLTDPVVYASLRIFILAIIANKWELVPSLKESESDYSIALQMRDFVKENLLNLETSYDNVLEQHLQAMAHGASVNEQVFYIEDMRYTRATPQLRIKDIRDKPLINTIFVVDSFNNTVAIMTQRFPGQVFPASSYIPIDFSIIGATHPDEKFDLSNIVPGILPRASFSVLSNEMRYNDERGHSALRTAYQAWWFKQQQVAQYLAYTARFAEPSLVGTTPPNAQPQAVVDLNLNPVTDTTTGLPQTITPEQAMSEALQAFQNGSAIAIPNGGKVDAIEAGGDGSAFINALNWCDRQLAYAITNQALATQEGQHQARASSETHQDILSLGILRRKLWLASQQEREVYKRLLMYNFDQTGKKIARYVPRLNLGLGDGFPVTPEDIAKLMASGYLGQDPAQLEKIDDMLGLPHREHTTVTMSTPMTPTRPQNQYAPPGRTLWNQHPQQNEEEDEPNDTGTNHNTR